MFAGGQRNWNKSVLVEIQFFGKGSQLHAALTRISKLRQFFIGNLRNEDDGGWRKIIKGDIGFRFGREREKRSWYYFSFYFFRILIVAARKLSSGSKLNSQDPLVLIARAKDEKNTLKETWVGT